MGTDGFDQSIATVSQGRADATINSNLSFLDFKKHKPDAPVKIVAERTDAEQEAVLIRKGEPELRQRSMPLSPIFAPTAATSEFPASISARTSRSSPAGYVSTLFLARLALRYCSGVWPIIFLKQVIK